MTLAKYVPFCNISIQVMKMIRFFPFFGVASVMASIAFSADPVKLADEYIPEKNYAQGSLVRVQLDESLTPHMQKIDAAAAKLTKEVQDEIRKTIKPGYPVPFDERLGLNKNEYDAYIESWNKKEVVDIAKVVLRFVPTADKGVYKVASSTETGPLPLSTLQYDQNKGVWISPNGVLERKNDVDYSELNNLGAWKGYEWMLEKKTSYSHMVENVLVGKTTDGSYVYVIYNFLEVTSAGEVVDNKTIVVRIPAVSADPLLEKAKQNRGQKL